MKFLIRKEGTPRYHQEKLVYKPQFVIPKKRVTIKRLIEKQTLGYKSALAMEKDKPRWNRKYFI